RGGGQREWARLEAFDRGDGAPLRNLLDYFQDRGNRLRSPLRANTRGEFGHYVRALLHEVITGCVPLHAHAPGERGPAFEGLVTSDGEHPARRLEILKRHAAGSIKIGFGDIQQSLY